jgi:hypothetical protein
MSTENKILAMRFVLNCRHNVLLSFISMLCNVYRIRPPINQFIDKEEKKQSKLLKYRGETIET